MDNPNYNLAIKIIKEWKPHSFSNFERKIIFKAFCYYFSNDPNFSKDEFRKKCFSPNSIENTNFNKIGWGYDEEN